MKLKKKKLNKDRICFKKRYNLTLKNKKLYFGTHGIFFRKTTRLELIYLVMFRKLIKRLKHPAKKNVIYHKKMWFWLKKNYPLSKKSKNSRMGKGKGKFLRWVIRIPANYVILEFFGWSSYSLQKICSKINKKNNLSTKLFSNLEIKPKVIMSKHKYSYLLVNKYTLF